MTLTELSLAILALLVTPGPTNTLMFLAGAEGGLRRALRLIPAELAGYMLTTVPLALAGAQVLAAVPGAQALVTLAAGLWVAVLALRLWRPDASGTTRATVTGRRVLVTTLLNPKALVFGLVLLPAPGLSLAVTLPAFAGQIALVALGWAAAGMATTRHSGAAAKGGRMALLRRGAALWLGLVSAGLLLRAAQV